MLLIMAPPAVDEGCVHKNGEQDAWKDAEDGMLGSYNLAFEKIGS